MINIVPHDNLWKQRFIEISAGIRSVVDDACAIHHIGSTSVPGLGAKDVIDIQLSIPGYDERIIASLQKLGFTFRDDVNSDHRPPGRHDIPEAELTKWYFSRKEPKVHLHVRRFGSFNQRYPLLCRDFLRNNTGAAHAYEAVKINLAKYFPVNVEAYYDIKDPVFDIIMAGAELWATQTSWQLPGSDA